MTSVQIVSLTLFYVKLIAPYVFYVDLIEKHMARWFHRALSTMLANITIDIFNDLDEVEVCSGTVSS